MSNLSVQIQNSMTAWERAHFMRRARHSNPRLKGPVKVADVIDMLVDMDAHLDITQPMIDHFAGDNDMDCVAPVALALFYAYNTPPSTTRVQEFCFRDGMRR